MLKKALLFIICIAFIFASSFAQRTAELGVFFGRSYYLGEINPTTHYGDNVGSLTYGGVFRYNLNKRYSLRASLIRTKLNAEDKLADLEFNTFRDASFETTLTDFSGTIEFNFLPFEQGSKKHYKYNPTTEIAGIEIGSEETQGGTKVALPFGPGLKFSIRRNLGLGLEWGFRKTTNDELDGLPNRDLDVFEVGKPYDNDWYVVTGLILTYRITGISPCPYYGF